MFSIYIALGLTRIKSTTNFTGITFPLYALVLWVDPCWSCWWSTKLEREFASREKNLLIGSIFLVFLSNHFFLYFYYWIIIIKILQSFFVGVCMSICFCFCFHCFLYPFYNLLFRSKWPISIFLIYYFSYFFGFLLVFLFDFLNFSWFILCNYLNLNTNNDIKNQRVLFIFWFSHF